MSRLRRFFIMALEMDVEIGAPKLHVAVVIFLVLALVVPFTGIESGCLIRLIAYHSSVCH